VNLITPWETLQAWDGKATATVPKRLDSVSQTESLKEFLWKIGYRL
jgi:hypothetical protein